MIIRTLKHLWLVLDICVKSMAQTIILNGSHKISRRKRFSAFTADSMQSMFVEVSNRIVQNYQRFPSETRAANVALAYFAKYCLNLADRGIVLNVIYEVIKTYDLLESGASLLTGYFIFSRTTSIRREAGELHHAVILEEEIRWSKNLFSFPVGISWNFFN